MPSNPTIYDVSRLSGVSTATVSRAFSNPEHVKEYTRRKVYEAAEALHYSPNAIARAMARQRTDKIAYLICKKDATVLDEFYAGICEGIMQSANHSEFQLLVSTAEDWLHNVSTAQAKQIEGVILGGDAKAELVSELQSRGVAVVLVNNRMRGFDMCGVRRTRWCPPGFGTPNFKRSPPHCNDYRSIFPLYFPRALHSFPGHHEGARPSGR